jgi:hypothetical protein
MLFGNLSTIAVTVRNPKFIHQTFDRKRVLVKLYSSSYQSVLDQVLITSRHVQTPVLDMNANGFVFKFTFHDKSTPFVIMSDEAKGFLNLVSFTVMAYGTDCKGN